MKPVVVLPLALVLALLLAIPAAAAPPVIETFPYYSDAPLVDQPCQGIVVWDREEAAVHQITSFGKEGDLTQIKLHFLGTDTFYNPQNPGFELSGSFSANAEVDLQTGELIHGSGLPVHITLPGYGTVFVRAGFWTRYPNEHQGGKDSLTDPKDMAQFCALLAGN